MTLNDLKIGDLVKLKSSLFRCRNSIEEFDGQLNKSFIVKAGSFLIYQGYVIKHGFFLKFINVENCKIVYDYWSIGQEEDVIHKRVDMFEIIK